MRFEDVINQIAKNHNVTADEVLAEMQAAISEAFHSSDSAAQEAWSQTPFQSEQPTPEQLISYLVTKLSC